MKRLIKNPLHRIRRIYKKGLPPGSMVFTGEQKVENPNVTFMQYDESQVKEYIMEGYDCQPAELKKVTWYDVRGLSDIKLVEHIGNSFQMHPLAIEDVLNTSQRSKWEDYPNGAFLVIRALRLHNEDPISIMPEQIAIYLKKEVVLTFQEDADDLFKTVRDRIHKEQGKIRFKGTDYLTYTLIDCIVDDYFVILDKIEEHIEKIENEILTNYTPSVRSEIYYLKRQLTDIRRAVLPLRDVVSRFSREEGRLFDSVDNIYIRDLYDHVIRVIEILENQQDTIRSLTELYNAEQSHRANHVMKTLTIISAIFIPLTFIVGVYGTNFDVLPELHYPKGYFYMWIVMIIIAILQLIYFKNKKWL
jgi:magnesium transporter